MATRKRKHTGNADTAIAKTLQDERSQVILEVFDYLRQNGIDEEVPLPRLIVGGDTSSGKSSVLQRLTGILFPSGVGVVTRFATEVAMRPAEEKAIIVKISPDKSRPITETRTLREFNKTMSSMAEFQKVYKAATDLLGKQQNKQGLMYDVLRINVRGPDQPPLTVVDLPGLIQAKSNTVTALDKEVSHKIVDQYFQNPRAIILAIVSADNCVVNQEIMDKAADADPQRERTLRIVTKPDAVMAGSDKETEWLKLARNEEIVLQRGWHVLMNKAGDLKIASPEEHEEAETEFFTNERFKDLDKEVTGL